MLEGQQKILQTINKYRNLLHGIIIIKFYFSVKTTDPPKPVSKDPRSRLMAELLQCSITYTDMSSVLSLTVSMINPTDMHLNRLCTAYASHAIDKASRYAQTLPRPPDCDIMLALTGTHRFQ